MLEKIKLAISEITNKKKYSISIKSLEELKYFNGAKQIFTILKKKNKNTKLMFVGGCVRKLLNQEEISDIDIAINLSPEEIKNILTESNIKVVETGILHGTVTVIINNLKFEITTLRKDISTDGRHADVEFISDWETDAKRRDFTINAIYSDLEGKLYDPLNGKKDLENKIIKFIGSPEVRIKEDYLRILRYFRFYTQYSTHEHEAEVMQAIKKGLTGLTKVSKERILDELFKILNLKNFYDLFNNIFSCSTILNIFPQLKYYNRFEVIKNLPSEVTNRLDVPLILSILLVDNSDNCEFFLYKFKFSNKEKKRIFYLLKKYKEIKNQELLNEKNLVKLAYLDSVEAVIDLLVFFTFASKEKNIKTIGKQISFLEALKLPVFPITADYLKSHYNFSEGKELGVALKTLEQFWMDNNFVIDKSKIKNILKLQ